MIGHHHRDAESPPRHADRDAAAATSPRIPIADYALIGDCRTAALVSRDGSIDWLCLPHFSAPSIFARLLDRQHGGYFAIRPVGRFEVSRRYLGETAVLETTFRTSNGIVRLTDLFPIGRNADSLEPTRELLRCVEGIAGEVELEITLDPRPDYGRRRLVPEGSRQGWRYTWSNKLLLMRTDVTLDRDEGALHGSVLVRAGERRYFSLAYTIGDVGVILPLGRAADDRVEHALAWWREWSGRCTYQGPHRDAVIRSALTLKLLSFSLSGAILAAPTTSLPETIGGSRNWDYRYCWLRDAGLTMQALIGLGFNREARAFLDWLLHATRLTWPKLRVLYDVYGRAPERERCLDHWAGYGGSRPVRVGNGADTQLQLDVYGEVILAADAYIAGNGPLDALEMRMLAGLAEVVCREWRMPDHSIWEIRGAPRHYTFSKVMCWLALDRLLNLHEKGVLPLRRERQARFISERRAIAETIEQRGFNAGIASYVGELDGERVDTSLLLMVCLGYKDAADPRMVATYERIQQRLEVRDLLYRYEPAFDSLEGEEGAFGLCAFWAIDNLAKRGDLKEAERRFAHLLSFANDLGLFAEETDPKTGAALGNFPQAFTHVGLINAALALARARSSRGAAHD